jgi:hypothetical protein
MAASTMPAGTAYWWSATEIGSGYAWNRNMNSGNDYVAESNNHKGLGGSVLCLQD